MTRTRLLCVSLVVAIGAVLASTTSVQTMASFSIGVAGFWLVSGILTLAVLAVLVVFHEAAHAVTALVLGWRVQSVVIGSGSRTLRCKLGSIRIEIGALPICGLVHCMPRARRWPGAEYALICLAGPLSELLLLAIVLAYPMPLRHPDAQFVALVFKAGIFLHAMASLIPQSYQSPAGPIANDGLQALRALRGQYPRPLAELVNDRAYPAEAFQFVADALVGASVSAKHSIWSLPHSHVRGASLCYALRDSAIESFGPEARQVLASWGIRSCEDFGRIVFAMVDSGAIQKSADDRIEDFSNVFDFDAAFSEGAELLPVEAKAAP